MKAALAWEAGRKLEVRDVDVAAPGPGEIRVRLGASGICHSDLSVVDGTVPFPWFPAVLGHEGAGEVIEVGENVDRLAVGDHVLLWMVGSCGSCRLCISGKPNLCTHLALDMAPPTPFTFEKEPIYAGLQLGTFADETVVHARHAIKLPPEVPLEVAALLGCGVTTGLGAALNTARVEPGSTVVVLGCGGVGISVIQGARLAGATAVVAIDKFESKLEWARQFGADHVGHPEQLMEFVDAITDGIGFDYAFEVVGSASTIRQAVDATRRGGTTVVVGAGRMDDPVEFSAFELFFMDRNLTGCVLGGSDPRRDVDRYLRLWKSGRLNLEGLISRRVNLEDVNDAFDAMQCGEVIRSVVTW